MAASTRIGFAALAAVALTAAALGGCGGGSETKVAADQPPLPPDPQTAKPAAEAPAPATPDPSIPTAKEIKQGKAPLPPASAGSNGSYDPPSPEEQRRIAARTHPVGDQFADERAATQLGGTALAPAGAPDPIRRMISAANLIVGQPYKWGGGHASWRSAGYDCSGAVSYALAGAGVIQAPMTSGQFMRFGAPGPGEWLTIFANPGHVYAVIAGLRWDTVGDAKGSGPRWHPFDAYPDGFVARHIPGL